MLKSFSKWLKERNLKPYELAEEDMGSLLEHLLTSLFNKKWKKEEKMVSDYLISPVALTKELEVILENIKSAIMENNLNKTKSEAKTLKSIISKWFTAKKEDNLTASDNVEEIITPESDDYKQRLRQTEWKRYIPSYVTLDKDQSRRTIKSDNSAKAQFRRNELPNGDVSSKYSNFNATGKVTVSTLNHESEDNRKIIRMAFNRSRTGFHIEFYKTWREDLKNLLSKNDEKNSSQSIDTRSYISPIFIPSKGRFKGDTANLTFLIDMGEDEKDVDELQPFDHLIYVVVEERELEKYKNCLDENRLESLILVSIPGKNRGVAFSRSMIKLLQEQMRDELLKEHIRFDWWWMLDDDIQMARIFYITCGNQSLMRRCTIGLALYETEGALRDIIKKTDNRISEDSSEDNYSNFEEVINDFEAQLNLNRSEAKKTSKLWEKKFTQLLHCLDTNDTNEAKNIIENGLKNRIGKVPENFNDKFRDFFIKMKNKSDNLLESGCKGIQMSIAACRTTDDRCNYNFVGKEMHYRVSSQRHGCVLNYAPGLLGYNYLTFEQLLLSQDTVDEEFDMFQKESAEPREKRMGTAKKNIKEKGAYVYKYRDYFLGEDKKFVELLQLDNRSGYQMYFFDVEFGKQRTGGCFHFRKKGVVY